MKYLQRNILYVRIGMNRVMSRNVTNGSEYEHLATTPFTTNRLLIGSFYAGAEAIREATRKTMYGGLPPIGMVLHPLEMVEGGLSEVEERVLLEVAANAGSKKSTVHIGRDLSDEEVKECLLQRNKYPTKPM